MKKKKVRRVVLGEGFARVMGDSLGMATCGHGQRLSWPDDIDGTVWIRLVAEVLE